MTQEIPLAERMRPKSLEDYIGQPQLMGPEGIITKMLQADYLPSMILWGPPGTGKTTLARLLAEVLKRPFHQLSAVSAGLREVRELIEKAKTRDLFSPNIPVLFIDEIHRFNKSQQESLLEAMEKGWLSLIGATTENPGFEVVPALLSRAQVYTLSPLNIAELKELAQRAIEKDSWLSKKKIRFKQYGALLSYSNGDARKLLNALELVVSTLSGQSIIDVDDGLVRKSIAQRSLHYDKAGEQHYDIASAFIKSLRASQTDAALYWLARMIEGGEEIKFIARRMLIFASEDIGNADSMALVLANSTFQAVNVIGHPESRILLSQCTVYLAQAPKSNASYKAINAAQEYVRGTGDLPVPLHLRNPSTAFMKELGYGKGYKSPHDNKEDENTSMSYFPEGINEIFLSKGSNELI